MNFFAFPATKTPWQKYPLRMTYKEADYFIAVLRTFRYTNYVALSGAFCGNDNGRDRALTI
jgi:hypothetical protein